MRTKVYSWLVGTVLVAELVAAPFLCYYGDPLRTLRRHAAAVSYVESGYRNIPGNDQFWHAMQVLSVIRQDLGYEVTFGNTGMYGGFTQYEERTMAIAAGIGWNEKLAVLAHEGGHALAPRSLDKHRAEVFAEAVSYLVCRSFGLNTLYQSSRYIAMHKQALSVIEEYREEIQRAARILKGDE